jgi:MFS family permease
MTESTDENTERTAQAHAKCKIECSNRSMLKITIAMMIGGAIEAFDFLAYGTATAVAFNRLFFPAIDAAAGQLAAFGTFAAGFFARPVGGLIFGYFGDRLGRKKMLMIGLILMGVANCRHWAVADLRLNWSRSTCLAGYAAHCARRFIRWGVCGWHVDDG